ncbi:MAG: tetratricopeptide repeat protein [Candidatus Omnitrophica bacterium]|nr:tetratricopeptide repeat protein [Candidatus Omnitrophota bacterium]
MLNRPRWPGIVSGLFLCLILLELGLRLAVSVSLYLQERGNRGVILQKGTYRILCVGDSITAKGGMYSYPSQLQDILNQRGTGVKFSVINGGVFGIHTSTVLDSLESSLDAHLPDMVISMMGDGGSGAYMFHDPVFDLRGVNFFRSFMVYKSARAVWSRVARKPEDPGLGKMRKNAARSGSFGKDGHSNGWKDAGIRRFYQGQEKGRADFELGLVYARQGKFIEAGGLFEKAILLNPLNDRAYVELGWIYRVQEKSSEAEAAFRQAVKLNPKNLWPYVEQGQFAQAEASFRKAIKLDPRNVWLYIGLGWIYLDQGKFPEAETAFKKAKDVNPQNNWLDIGLGLIYLKQDKSDEAEALFKKAGEADPQNDWSYIGLGWIYQTRGEFFEAEAAIRKAIKINPKNNRAYFELGCVYQNQARLSEAEALFKKAIDVNPQDSCPYLKLGWLYHGQGRYSEAEVSFKKAIAFNPRNDLAYRTLKVLYAEMGNAKLAREYDRKANELRPYYYPREVIDNYRKLKAVLDRRGIACVCMQYPLRSIEPLKEIFRGDEYGIIFVDNQAVFQKALEKSSHTEYFTDMVGGDFGHCTPKGNRLLAENIADAVLEKVFGGY